MILGPFVLEEESMNRFKIFSTGSASSGSFISLLSFVVGMAGLLFLTGCTKSSHTVSRSDKEGSVQKRETSKGQENIKKKPGKTTTKDSSEQPSSDRKKTEDSKQTTTREQKQGNNDQKEENTEERPPNRKVMYDLQGSTKIVRRHMKQSDARVKLLMILSPT